MSQKCIFTEGTGNVQPPPSHFKEIDDLESVHRDIMIQL